MEKILSVRQVGLIARIADTLMVPIMYLISGTLLEKPQQTHAWNVQNVPVSGTEHLMGHMMVHRNGVKAIGRWGFLFHIPLLGGWKKYVVLDPDHEGAWHVGWKTNVVQISVLPLVGPVRMLLGSGDVLFFGVNDDGVQIPIVEIGEGCIGDHGRFSKIQLC